MFALIVVILILIYAIVSDDVSPFTATLPSSIITLSIPNSNNSGYNDLLIALNIKPNAYNLDDYNFNIYNLPT